MYRNLLTFIFVLTFFTNQGVYAIDSECLPKLIKDMTTPETYPANIRNLAKLKLSPIEYSRLLDETYELLQKKYNQFRIKSLKLKQKPIKLIDQITSYDQIPFEKSSNFRPSGTMSDTKNKLISRFHRTDRRFQVAYLEAFNMLNSNSGLKEYLKGLYTESFYWQVQNNQTGKYDKLINAGKIDKNILKTVLFQRLKARDDNNILVILPENKLKGPNAPKDQGKIKDNTGFRYAVGNGPFVEDQGLEFGKANHGSFTHLIQRDIVYPIIKKHYGDDYHQFYEYLGTKKGISFWIDLFDSGIQNSMTRPERLSREVYDLFK